MEKFENEMGKGKKTHKKIQRGGRKKTWIAVAMACLMAVLSVAEPGTAAAKAYQFRYQGVTVTMNAAAKKLIQKAGKPLKKKVEKSCAYNGKDRTYTYRDFILYTYSNSDNGPEYIDGITFLSERVQTKEGIRIGSSLSAVQKKYKNGSQKFGVYTYTRGRSRLQIEITEDKVTNIRYVLKKKS